MNCDSLKNHNLQLDFDDSSLGCHCDMTAGIALFPSDHGWGGADSSEPRPALTFCGISRGACALMFTLGVSELTWGLCYEDERGSPRLEA